MDQISRPVLFALIAAVGFAGVWMLALRPKAETGGETAAAAPVAASTQSAAAPGAGGLGRAVGNAEEAAATADAAAKAAEAAAEDPAGAEPAAPPAETAVTPAPESAAESAPKAAPDPKPARAVKTVLLFAGRGADDAIAREVVRSVRRPGVRVIVASLGDVVKYQEMLGALEIAASPTILVFGKDRKAQRIEGLPDVAQVQQALRAAN